MLYSLKCFFDLLGIDRGSDTNSNDPGSTTYVNQVQNAYDTLFLNISGLYKNQPVQHHKLYPDCTAPQFCCSTNIAYGLENCCGPNICKPVLNLHAQYNDSPTPVTEKFTISSYIGGVPTLDERVAISKCGKKENTSSKLINGTGDLTALGGLPLNGSWKKAALKGAATVWTIHTQTADAPHINIQSQRSGFNTCVLAADCCDTLPPAQNCAGVDHFNSYCNGKFIS